MFSNVWSENTALFERLMEIHSDSPNLYYGVNHTGYRVARMYKYQGEIYTNRFQIHNKLQLNKDDDIVASH